MEQIAYSPLQNEILRQSVGLLTKSEYKMLLAGVLKGLAALHEETTVGVILYHMQGDRQINMEKIFVAEEYRRRGIGRKLLGLLCDFVRAKGYDLILSFAAEGLDAEICCFLKMQGGFCIEEEEGFEALLSREHVAELCRTLGKEMPEKDPKEVLFFEQRPALRQDFLMELEKSYPAIASEMKNTPQAFCQELCSCVADAKGIEAICMVKERGEELELSFLYAVPGKGVLAAKALMEAVKMLDGRESKPVRMMAINEDSIKILNHMSKNYEIAKKLYAAYYFG